MSDTSNIPVRGIETVDYTLSQTLPVNTVAHLCHAIQESFSGSAGGHVVAFVSPQVSLGTGRIAFEAAYVAGTLLGLRVLFVDTQLAERKERAKLVGAVRTSVMNVLHSGGTIDHSMVTIDGSRLTYMLAGKLGHGGLTLADMDIFNDSLNAFRAAYDLIIIEAPSILDGPFGVGVVKMSDGAVLVVDAEKTRAPVALQAKQTIEVAGGRIIGAVLNNRRLYIPRWIYRWI
jgi:Mrp family chromosome partitioning ATPase